MFEFRTASVDRMNEVLDAKHAVFTEGRLDDVVIGQRNSLSVDFSVSTRVDEFSDCFRCGISPSNTIANLL